MSSVPYRAYDSASGSKRADPGPVALHTGRRARAINSRVEKGSCMFCNNCNNSYLWLIIILIILFGWNGNGCGCGCESNNNGCGCGC